MLTKDITDEMAHLARIALSAEESEHMFRDVKSILSWMEKIRDLNLPDLPEESHTMPLRNDVVCQGVSQKGILQNAPQKEHGMFVVPKVV